MFYVAATPLLPYTFVQPVTVTTNLIVPKTPISVQHVVHHHVRHHINEYEVERPRSVTPVKKTIEHHYYHHYHRSLTPPSPISRKVPTDEELDARLECVRNELRRNYVGKCDQSTETIDYYHPSPTPITYKQHFDAPKPLRTRSRARSRSPSLPRTPSLPREPWRSSNQNDYPWRDAHLPAYRQVTLDRHQEKITTKPISTNHLFYSDVQPVHGDCIHIVPKSNCCGLTPPYLKILDAPVTYLH